MLARPYAIRARGIAAALLLSIVAPAAVAAAEPGFSPADDVIELTARDVEASNAKVAAAYSALVEMWAAAFRDIGVRFQAPKLVRHRNALRTECGVVTPSNASYCYDNNTIYFDDLFLAAQAKLTGREFGTDGDMAAIGIVAHEFGHAVAFQLGVRSRTSYHNEAIADCLAGAFAGQAEEDGRLEEGDVDEAFFAMAAAGDPELELTGDRRIDRRRSARLARGAHGTREQRMENFRAGFDGGGGACIPELRG
jgi:predicted metalloprotease